MWNIINQGDYNIFSNKKIALWIKVIKKRNVQRYMWIIKGIILHLLWRYGD